MYDLSKHYEYEIKSVLDKLHPDAQLFWNLCISKYPQYAKDAISAIEQNASEYTDETRKLKELASSVAWDLNHWNEIMPQGKYVSSIIDDSVNFFEDVEGYCRDDEESFPKVITLAKRVTRRAFCHQLSLAWFTKRNLEEKNSLNRLDEYIFNSDSPSLRTALESFKTINENDYEDYEIEDDENDDFEEDISKFSEFKHLFYEPDPSGHYLCRKSLRKTIEAMVLSSKPLPRTKYLCEVVMFKDRGIIKSVKESTIDQYRSIFMNSQSKR